MRFSSFQQHPIHKNYYTVLVDDKTRYSHNIKSDTVHECRVADWGSYSVEVRNVAKKNAIMNAIREFAEKGHA